MTVSRIVLLAALLLPFAAPVQRAQAQQTRLSRTDGNKLLGVCTARNPAYVQGCEAYIDGVADTVAVYQRSAANPNSGVKIANTMCVPADITGAQLREAVVGWLQSHPNDRGHEAGLIVFRVLHDAYPCH